MFPSRRRLLLCATFITLSLLLLLLATPDWYRPVRPIQPSRPPGRSPSSIDRDTGRTVGNRGGQRVRDGKQGARPAGSRPTVRRGKGSAAAAGAPCPSGLFTTISAHGRLGNKLCEYATLWTLQRDDPRARPARILPEMQRALSPLFGQLPLPTLPQSCVKNESRFLKVKYSRFDQMASAKRRRPILISDYPCDAKRFHKYRDTILHQLTFRDSVHQEAQRQLRRSTAALCGGGPSPCTYIGVHVRRTDYRTAVRRMYKGTLVGERYLTRALQLCRRRYRRPVFVVSSDDLSWVRRRLRGSDIVIAGSGGAGSAERDLALLAQCNHTVMTHGTYGFWAAYLAQGDVFAPTGFGARDSFLSAAMGQTDLNITMVPAF